MGRFKVGRVVFYDCPPDCPAISAEGATAGKFDSDTDNNGIPYLEVNEAGNKIGYEPRAKCDQPNFRPRATRGRCFLKDGNYDLGSWRGSGNKEQEL